MILLFLYREEAVQLNEPPMSYFSIVFIFSNLVDTLLEESISDGV